MPPILLGSGLALWMIWIGGTVTGYCVGALVEDPRRYGIDVVMPVFFAVILVPLWRGPRAAAPWLVAGVVALVVARALPGAWYMVAGVLAGAMTGGLQRERT